MSVLRSMEQILRMIELFETLAEGCHLGVLKPDSPPRMCEQQHTAADILRWVMGMPTARDYTLLEESVTHYKAIVQKAKAARKHDEAQAKAKAAMRRVGEIHRMVANLSREGKTPVEIGRAIIDHGNAGTPTPASQRDPTFNDFIRTLFSDGGTFFPVNPHAPAPPK